MAEFLRKATGADFICSSIYFCHRNVVHLLLLLLIVLFWFSFAFLIVSLIIFSTFYVHVHVLPCQVKPDTVWVMVGRSTKTELSRAAGASEQRFYGKNKSTNR